MKYSVIAVVAGLVLANIAPANASLARMAIARMIQAKLEARNLVTIPTGQKPDQSGTYDETLDHFTPKDQRTFKQRYAIFYGFAPADTTNAPVIYYQCGEGNCLDDGEKAVPSAIAYYAQNLGAVVVILEHRYYGKSQPFATMTGDDLQYLTYEQALEDFAEFEQYAIEQFSLNGKWIFAGGSYSGALSPYFRLKHPDLVVGSLSSSGVVKTELNYEDYDRVVATALPAQCLAAVQDVTHQVEQALTNPKQLAAYQATFQASDVKSGLDFLEVLASMVDGAAQYGMQADFCKTLLTSSDHVSGFAQGGLKVLTALGVTPVQETNQGLESTNASDYEGVVGLRQWAYQSCIEFGGFATPYHDSALSAQSSLLDLQYNLDACKTLFGVTTLPATDRINAEYYEPLLDPSLTSNVLYVDGALDPYMPLSITKENGNDTNPNTQSVTLPTGSHCSDLEYDKGETGPVAAVHAKFLVLAKQWLK